MGDAWHNGLFAADFQVHTLVQVFFVIQCIWTGCMGILVTIDPNFSPINEIGTFVRKPGTKKSDKGSKFLLSTLCAKKEESSRSDETTPIVRRSCTRSTHSQEDDTEEEAEHPNVRGSWNVRGGSMFLVAAGALFMGTRETYLVAMAAMLWREAYDTCEMFLYMKDYKKILLRPWMSPIGPMPPLLSFNICNVAAMWAILVAAK